MNLENALGNPLTLVALFSYINEAECQAAFVTSAVSHVSRAIDEQRNADSRYCHAVLPEKSGLAINLNHNT